MAIDASIYGQIQQFKPESQLNSLASILQVQNAQQSNQLNKMKMDEHERGVQEQNALRSLLGSQGFDISKPEWQQQMLSASPKAGMEFIKQHLEGRRAQTEAESKSFDLANKRYGAYKTTLGSLANDPALSKDRVLAAGQELVNMGILTPEMFQQTSANLPDDPAQLRIKLTEGLKSQLTPEQIFTVFSPKVTTVDNGQQIYRVDDNPNSPTFGQRIGAAPVQKVATPGEQLSAATTRRGQNMTDSRARETAQLQKDAQRVQVVETPDGVMLVDKGTGLARPAATFDGKNLPGRQSEAVKKELMSIGQQRSILQGAIDAVDHTPSAFSFGRGVAGKVPFGETLAGRSENSAETQARAYVFNNVSRVINERAGAAQSAQELARLNAFLPADTDGPKQIKDKLIGFQRYLTDLEAGTTGKPGASPKPALNFKYIGKE